MGARVEMSSREKLPLINILFGLFLILSTGVQAKDPPDPWLVDPSLMPPRVLKEGSKEPISLGFLDFPATAFVRSDAVLKAMLTKLSEALEANQALASNPDAQALLSYKLFQSLIAVLPDALMKLKVSEEDPNITDARYLLLASLLQTSGVRSPRYPQGFLNSLTHPLWTSALRERVQLHLTEWLLYLLASADQFESWLLLVQQFVDSREVYSDVTVGDIAQDLFCTQGDAEIKQRVMDRLFQHNIGFHHTYPQLGRISKACERMKKGQKVESERTLSNDPRVYATEKTKGYHVMQTGEVSDSNPTGQIFLANDPNLLLTRLIQEFRVQFFVGPTAEGGTTRRLAPFFTFITRIIELPADQREDLRFVTQDEMGMPEELRTLHFKSLQKIIEERWRSAFPNLRAEHVILQRARDVLKRESTPCVIFLKEKPPADAFEAMIRGAAVEKPASKTAF